MYKLINVFDRNRKNGQFLAIFAMKNAIFFNNMWKNCTKTEFFCLVEHIVSVNNDKVGEYYEKLCMTFLYSSNRVNRQILVAILAAILDSELLLK